jgi:hypothetical protein
MVSGVEPSRMIASIFKKTVFISLLGHITVFSIVGFSFGVKIPQANFADIYFWGDILRGSNLIGNAYSRVMDIKDAVIKKQGTLVLDKTNKESLILPNNYLKPQVNLVFSENKITLAPKSIWVSPILKRKELAIMFYPPLPYQVILYFKDRQVVHIELMFNVISTGKNNSIVIKRKISSGNLEADLLSMRSIGRYLFIQQTGFIPNNWQTVKIDLSTK